MVNKKSLEQLYSEHTGKASDKWSSYLIEYDRILEAYRHSPVRLLEIGVQNGGSLEIWAKFFPNAVKIVGCDIEEKCAELKYEDPRVCVVVADANSAAAQEAITAQASDFDIIIDDGSHRSSDVLNSFACYFPLLADGGIYIVEDLHCSYWREHEGGLYYPFSSLTFFKRLADIVNQEHWGINRPASQVFYGVFSQYGFHMDEEILRAIHSVQFMNSLCIVRKQDPDRNRLGTRVVAGGEETVTDGITKLHGSTGARHDQTRNEWTTRDKPPEEELYLRLAELSQLENQVTDLRSRMRETEQTITQRDAHIKGLHRTISDRDNRITSLAATVADYESQLAKMKTRIRESEHFLTFARADFKAKKEELERSLDAERNSLKSTKEELEQCAANSNRLQRRIRQLEGELSSIHASPAWRITGPLRTLLRLLRLAGIRVASILLPCYRSVFPDRVREMVPERLRSAVKKRLKKHKGQSIRLEDKPPVTGTQKVKRTLGETMGEAIAAFNAGDLPRAIRCWRVVSDEFRDDPVAAGSAKSNLSLAYRLSNVGEYKDHIAVYVKGRANRVSQDHGGIVVYTVVSGNYDSIKLPERLDDRLDYVLFTDVPVPDTGIYQVKPITYCHEDATRAARFVKTHPHMLLRDYDIAIWVDASIMILGDLYPMVEGFLASGKAVAAIPHPRRISIYEEVDACVRQGKDDPETMRAQADHYRSGGFVHNDLLESGLMMFDLRNDRIRTFLDSWWTEIDRFSKRDQLSLNYALVKSGLDPHWLTERPNSLRDHPLFALVPHGAGDGLENMLIDALGVSLLDPYEGPSYASIREERISGQRNRPIDIVVCVHNALEDVRRCLDSVRRERKSEVHRLIIIDDGSDSVTARYLQEFAAGETWVDLHRNDEAMGYAKSANQGLAASTGELVVLLNSDTLVTDGWLEKLADAVFFTPGAGIVGPVSNAASHQSIPEHRGSGDQTAINDIPPWLTPEDMNRYCEQWTAAHVLPRVPIVHGFCIGITREVLDKIGLFDDNSFPRGYGEENDYCFRATDAGFSLVVATHTFVFHAKSKSYSNPVRISLMKEGSQTLSRLHGRARVLRAVRSMEANPLLEDLRKKAKSLYLSPAWGTTIPMQPGVHTPKLSKPSNGQWPKSVLAIVPVSSEGWPTASAYVRVVAPLQHPSLSPVLQLSLAHEVMAAFSEDFDAILIQRDAVKSPKMARDLIDHCRQKKIRLIYEIDDYLLDLPETHPSFKDYSPALKEAMLSILSEAEAVLTSTVPLKERLRGFNDNVYVLPNALDEGLWLPAADLPPTRGRDDQIRILYMGTRTHNEDLALVSDSIKALQVEWGDRLSFTCIGGFSKNPQEAFFLTESVPKWAATYPNFARWMANFQCYDIGIGPLVDNEFARCKSYIKYLDYGICGILPVMSSVRPYLDAVRHNETGLLVKNRPEEWFHALCALMEDPERRDELRGNAREDVLTRHTLSSQAQQRRQFWQGLLSSSGPIASDLTKVTELIGTSRKAPDAVSIDEASP